MGGTAVRSWFLFNLRRAVGTQALIEQVMHLKTPAPPVVVQVAAPEPPMTRDAIKKLNDLYTRIADSSLPDDQLGFCRDHVPVLVDLNGDLLWLPGDLLKFVWHTRLEGTPNFIVHLLAETPHYVWIRERLRRGDTCIDCGANMGLFSTMMANRVGPSGAVHAFEPSPRSRRDLARVLQLNELPWVQICPSAVADQSGVARFCEILEADVRREASHLAHVPREGFTGRLAQESIEVSVTTLDQYVAENHIKPNLIKIDVEGAEFDVLEGARECVRQHRPRMAIEVHADSRTDVFDDDRLQRYLSEYGYQFRSEHRMYYCEPV